MVRLVVQPVAEPGVVEPTVVSTGTGVLDELADTEREVDVVSGIKEGDQVAEEKVPQVQDAEMEPAVHNEEKQEDIISAYESWEVPPPKKRPSVPETGAFSSDVPATVVVNAERRGDVSTEDDDAPRERKSCTRALLGIFGFGK